jgi:hypothetical protein
MTTENWNIALRLRLKKSKNLLPSYETVEASVLCSQKNPSLFSMTTRS